MRKYTRKGTRRQVIQVIVAACLALFISFWFNAKRDQQMKHSSAPFVSLPSAVGIDPKAVTIYAPLNCPSSAAKYADEIAKQLTQQNIPISRINNLDFQFPSTDMAAKEKMDSIMNGERPIVIVKGRAKGNPAISEVINEYRR